MDINIAGKLFPNITTIVVQLLSTGVMLFFFKKFLWVPIQEYFAKRAALIEDNINNAKDMQVQAKVFIEESEKQAREAAVEYRNIVEQAKEEAKQAKEVILADAKRAADEKIERAVKEIEVQKQAAKQQMKEEIVEVAIEVASKVMNKEMNSKQNKILVEDFVEEVVN